MKSCLDAVQVHGGSRFMTELELERELRDSVGSTLYSGTSEIQRNIIARGLRLWSLPSPSAIDAKTGGSMAGMAGLGCRISIGDSAFCSRRSIYQV